MIIKPKSNRTKGIIASSFMVFALIAQPMYGLVASQVAEAASPTVSNETELLEALTSGKTEINLNGNIGVNNQISVNYSTTFNGGTIKALTPGTYGSDDAVVHVSGADVIFTANNTVFDGNNQGSKSLFGDKRRQGVKVYGGATANLNSVTIKNAKKSGLHVNGDSVANVKDITTISNGALYGGLVVSDGGTINIDGKSTHNEPLRRDARIDGSGTINDNNDQYTTGNIRWLKSAPGAPAITAPASPVTTSTANLTWTAPSTSGNKNAAESYLVSINGGADVSVSGLTHSLTGLTDGSYVATVQSVAKSGLLGGTATHNFTVAIPDTEKPEGSATYAGGYLNPTTNVRYVKNIEDLSFTVNATDNKGVAWATYRAWNVTQSEVEACGNWNTSVPTAHIFTAPLQTDISYTVLGSSVKTCDSSMKWETGSRYQFIHAVYDTAGNESEKFNSTNQLVEIDSTQPVISIVKPLANSTVNGIVPVEVKITENGSGVKYVNALFTDGLTPEFGHTALTLKPGTTDTYVGQIDTTGKDGKFSLGINVSDNVGNTSDKAQNITIDNTPPAAPYDLSFKMSNGGIRSSGDWANLPKGDVTWNHSNSSDVKSYVYYSWNSIDGSKYHENNKWKRPNIISKSLNGVEFNQGEGKYFFCVAAVDAIGNESDCSETFEIGYDKTDPVVTITKPTGPIDTNEKFTIEGTYSDSLSGVGRLLLYVSANGNTLKESFSVTNLNDTPNDTHNFQYKLTQTDLDNIRKELKLADGQELTIKAWAYDKANNWSNTTSTIISDTTAPTAEIVSPATGAFVKTANEMEIKLHATDAVGMRWYDVTVWKKDDPRVQGSSPLASWSHEVPASDSKNWPTSFKLANNLNLPDGEYTIYFTATDLLGRYGNAEPVNFTVKSEPPTISINEVGTFNTNRPTITGIVSKDATKVEVSIDGGTKWEDVTTFNKKDGTWLYTYTEDLANGSHTILARATDSAGNTGKTSGGENSVEAKRVFSVNVTSTSTSGAGTQSPSGTTVITTPTRLAILQTTTNPTAIAANTTEDATADGEEVLGTSTTSERERSASVLAATDNKDENKVEWSIVNAITAVITVLVSIIALAGISKKQGRGKTLSVVTIVPAIGAVVAFFMLENLSSPMVFLNAWSWLFVGALAVQVFIFAMTKQKSSDNE